MNISQLLTSEQTLGMNFIEIALAQVLVQTIFIVNQTTLVMIVMFAVFDNPFVGDIFPSFLLLTLIGSGGMCFGTYSYCILKNLVGTLFCSSYLKLIGDGILKYPSEHTPYFQIM